MRRGLLLSAVLWFAPSFAASAPAAPILPPEPPGLVRIVDTRSTGPVREIPPLLTQIQSLEALYAATSEHNADRLSLLHRLAENYAALERAYLAANKPADASVARKKSIHYTTTFLPLGPNDPQNGTYNYHLGLEYVADEDVKNARDAWAKVIVGTTEPVGAMATFLAGETWLAEPKTPGALRLAATSYESAFARLPANHPLRPWALLRLGTVQQMSAKTFTVEAWDRLRRDYPTSEAAAQLPGKH